MANIMRYVSVNWVEWLFALVTGALALGYRRILVRVKTTQAEQEHVREGVQALLRDRIIQAYNHYQEKGFCPIYALENVENLYRRYKALGGNGTVTQLVEEIKELPRERKNRNE